MRKSGYAGFSSVEEVVQVVSGISNQVDEAERLLVKTLELLGWGSWMELHGFIELALLYDLRGNYAGVQEILQRMSRLGPQHATCAEALKVLLDIRRTPDEPQVRDRAEAWTRKHTPDPSVRFALGVGPYHCDTEYFCNLSWARVQIALGHFQDASSFIGPGLQAATEFGLLYRVAELSIAQSLIYDGQGNPSAAQDELEKALEIAQTCGYTRFFDDCHQLDRLFHKATERKTYGAYARQLLITFQPMRALRVTARTATRGGKEHSDLVDPLSERKLEVLRLLADALSPAEVAKKLFLSPYTLKAHTQNIYTKLGVHSRIEAISKAREMKLL